MKKVLISEGQHAMLLAETSDDRDFAAIKQVFEKYPVLAKIGSEEEYKRNLNHMVNSPRFKHIVYHGTNAGHFDKFVVGRGGAFGEGVYLQSNYGKYHTGTFGENIMFAIITAKNPFDFYPNYTGYGSKVHPLWTQLRDKHEKTGNYEYGEAFKQEFKEILQRNGFDSLIIQDQQGPDEFTYLVYDPDDVHILGSKKDIDRFKQWVS